MSGRLVLNQGHQLGRSSGGWSLTKNVGTNVSLFFFSLFSSFPPLLFLYSSFLLLPFSSFLFSSLPLFSFFLFSISFFFFSPFPNWCPVPHQYLKANGAPVLNYELKCFLDHWEFGQTSGTDCCPLVWSIRHFRVWENTISLTTQSDAGDTQTKSPPRHRVLHNAQKNPSPACITKIDDKNT